MEHTNPCLELLVLAERVTNLKGETEEGRNDMNGIATKFYEKMEAVSKEQQRQFAGINKMLWGIAGGILVAIVAALIRLVFRA